jgi:uncharacterized membrane protein YccC
VLSSKDAAPRRPFPARFASEEGPDIAAEREKVARAAFSPVICLRLIADTSPMDPPPPRRQQDDPRTVMKVSMTISHAQLAVRAGVAGALATWAAQLLGMEHPIYAFIGAVIVTDLSPKQSQSLGFRRILATAMGSVCGAALSQLLGPGPAIVGASVVFAMLAGYLLGAGEAAKVAGYICGIVVLDHAAEPWLYATQRFVETVLGVSIAWAISYAPKLINFSEEV